MTNAGAEPPEFGASRAADGGLPQEQLEALWEIARLANEDLELQPMMQRITDGLARRFGWDLVALVRILPEENRFECQAVTTHLDTPVRAGYSRPLGSGVVGRVALTGETICLDDVSEFSGFVETLNRTASEICVPVRHQGRVVAVLNAESSQPAHFAGQQLLFEAVAEQISGAVARGLLYEQVRARSEVLETLAEVSRRVVDGRALQDRLEDLVDYLRSRFELLLAAVMVSDDEGQYWQERAISMIPRVPIHRRQWPIGAGIVGRAVTQGRTVVVEDVREDPEYIALNDETRAEVVVPLKFGGRVLGALNVEMGDATHLSEASIGTFEAIANQVAGAIELAVSNRRLSEKERQLADANRELSLVNEELSRLAGVDELTSLANRRRLDRCLADESRRAQRHGEVLTLALLDVDFFKAFNDTYGHPAGDECLRRVASCLRSHAVRAGELVARYGGEEFAFVMPRLPLEEAEAFIDRTRRAVTELEIPHASSTVSEFVTLSAGVASLRPAEDNEVSDLLARADRALYQAKESGRNRTCRWTPQLTEPRATEPET